MGLDSEKSTLSGQESRPRLATDTRQTMWLGALGALIGAGAVAYRLALQGPTGVRAAVIIAGFSLAASGALGFRQLHPSERLTALALLLGAGVLLTVPTVGRVPFALAFASVVIADLAIFGGFRADNRSLGREPNLVSLAVTLGASLSWLAWSVNRVTLPLVMLAVGALVAGRSSPVTTLNRAIAHALGQAAVPVARGRRSLTSAAHRFSSLAAQQVGSAAVSIAELLRELGGRAVRVVRVSAQRRHRPILLVAAAAAAVTAPTFYRLVSNPTILVRGTNDVTGTLERVRWMQFWPPRIPVPHPGWSVAVKLTAPVLGEVLAVTVILALATGAASAILVTIGRSMWDDHQRLGWPFACFLGLGYVLMENPAVFAPRSDALWSRYVEAGTHARGQGYLPLHQWGTPTITMSMPFVFALFALLLMVLNEAEQPRPGCQARRRALAALTVASTLVQPATTLAVVPALPIYLLLSGRLTRRMAQVAMAWFILPGTLICLGQTWFLASKVSPWEQATWVWRPFWSLSYFGLDHPVYWTTAVFYVLCLWAGGRRYLADPAVGLSLAAVVVGFVPFALFEQTGLYEPEGDLGLPVLMALILLFVSSLRFVLLEVQARWTLRTTEGTRMPHWSWAVGLFLLTMVCAGSFDLIAAGGFIPEI